MIQLLSVAAFGLPAQDPALQAPPVNTSPGAEYADGARAWQGIPGIERAANGRLWALWYSGGEGEGPYNYVVAVTSADDGRTWSGPKVVIDPPGVVRAFDPCLWHDPKGRLWLFWAQGTGWWDGRSGVWAIVSEDSGDEEPTWSAPRRLCDGIMMNKPTVLSTGEWLLPAAVWRYPSNLPDLNRRAGLGLSDEEVAARSFDLGEGRGANLWCSGDEGETWSLQGQVHVPNSQFDEHMVVERRDGSLWMLVRTETGIGESVSTDRGRTWSLGQPSDIPHPATRFFIRRLASGRLLMVRHAPEAGKTRSHLSAYLSEDDGRTWIGGLLLDERRDVSYPDGVQAPDGTLYVIYDWSRTGAKEILMAVFTEEDILAGKPATDRARPGVLVNRAG